MIVRISGEGQFKLPDEDADRLNELDNRAVNAVEQGDETGFKELWSQMLEIVASDGNAVNDDELVESDVILPPRDISFDEARAEFQIDGGRLQGDETLEARAVVTVDGLEREIVITGEIALSGEPSGSPK